jgi:hypothetical protein
LVVPQPPLISQLLPLHPVGHLHVVVPPDPTTHVPPFRHGLGTQPLPPSPTSVPPPASVPTLVSLAASDSVSTLASDSVSMLTSVPAPASTSEQVCPLPA